MVSGAGVRIIIKGFEIKKRLRGSLSGSGVQYSALNRSDGAIVSAP